MCVCACVCACVCVCMRTCTCTQNRLHGMKECLYMQSFDVNQQIYMCFDVSISTKLQKKTAAVDLDLVVFINKAHKETD